MKNGLIDQIKERITCPDYMAREHGSRIIGGRCKSFRPDARNSSSLMVNERDWFDFGAGIGGDIIDLCAHDKYAGDKGAAIRYLAETWGIQHIIPKLDVEFRTYLSLLNDVTDFWHDSLHEEQMNYLRGRGLNETTINALRIGWADNPRSYLIDKGYTEEQIKQSGIAMFSNRIMVPYLRNGKTSYLIGRSSVWADKPSTNPEAKYVKLYRNELSEHPIWGFESLRRSGDVIIAEGIFDAISCWQENFAVVTAVTGAFSAEQKKDLFPALKGRDVIVCMDYDPETKAGQKFTETLANELFEAGIHVSACFLQGDGVKVDLSALYAKNPSRNTLEKAFAVAESWDAIKIRRISEIQNENEKRSALTAFLRRCSTVFDWPTVAQLVQDAKNTGKFAQEWLTQLKNVLHSPPKEAVVVDDFIRRYDCIYHESLGWYEYGSTVWERRSEHEIKGKIAKLYGYHQTARAVDSVFKLLKTRLLRKELFDQNKSLLNFPNGMFNVETGQMLPHSRDYYSSIQMEYPYNKDATCPKWNQFIEDVTGGDLLRHNLLQEMFGYCLTKDSRYQKCFCLIGDGANGKSVLLNVLEAMLGSVNTSHIEIAFLNSDFQRIKLLGSMANICNDIKTDVAGTESFMKAIIAGDPINGCYKGHDFVDFKPYCKMIFSSNRMITAKDVDYSYLRRFCFVNFPIRFVDAPSEPMERKRKPCIVNELLTELPGIFNWAYQGLVHLREAGKFTETSDQLHLEHELITVANPLVSFVEDVLELDAPALSGKVSRKDVFDRYVQWCNETHTMVMSARSFWPRLRTVIKFKETRTAYGWYVTFKPKRYPEEELDPSD